MIVNHCRPTADRLERFSEAFWAEWETPAATCESCGHFGKTQAQLDALTVAETLDTWRHEIERGQ